MRLSHNTSHVTTPGNTRESSTLVVPSCRGTSWGSFDASRGGRGGGHSGPRGCGCGTGGGRYPPLCGNDSGPPIFYHCGEPGYVKRKRRKLYGRPTQPQYANAATTSSKIHSFSSMPLHLKRRRLV
ncbi:hypothetical protein CFOL_v3_03096 [Cephalotus follicularis]|uniref:Uncharacterized protein n=1 Tax=Cephalotus follicularis TaxID=3775 RepID=A0A1Q3AV58_CEPFO|nr:hypothetical protein CFOL_v3_03096 [Cephalotus follicularis]